MAILNCVESKLFFTETLLDIVELYKIKSEMAYLCKWSLRWLIFTRSKNCMRGFVATVINIISYCTIAETQIDKYETENMF